MRDIMNARKQHTDIPRAVLNSAWYVDADSTYDVRVSHSGFGSSHIAVRTLAGCGHMTLKDGAEVRLHANTVGIFESNRIARYHTAADRWEFYWFEYDAAPCASRIDLIPISAQERIELERCFIHLGGTNRSEYLLADSLLNYLLADWTLRSSDTTHRQTLLVLLERGRREKMSVAQMAREAGMCERSFRTAVIQTIGISPKSYMIQCEMNAAMELLRTTGMTISEIAARFHYSSPFYFSRIFKKHFGISPKPIPFKPSPITYTFRQQNSHQTAGVFHPRIIAPTSRLQNKAPVGWRIWPTGTSLRCTE